jgi:hypothetical protein
MYVVQDAEDNAVRDGLIQAAADAQQARDDAERAAREAARARLMAEVDAIRQQQIADKVGVGVNSRGRVLSLWALQSRVQAGCISSSLNST